MEVDTHESCTYITNSTSCGKYSDLKAFVSAAHEFETTQSESALSMMTTSLKLVTSASDLSIFAPGRPEVCAFFNALWRMMSDGYGPIWGGVAVLARAINNHSAKHALTHTYKFMPVLAKLLTKIQEDEKIITLLTVMQDISYGMKISWQEFYLGGLMKQLTEWITRPMLEPQYRTIGQKSLTVLVNMCYRNLAAVHSLMRTVDTKHFVVQLMNLKEAGYGGVEVCRLLLCLTHVSRGLPCSSDVHSYLCCTMRTFSKAVQECDSTQLLHAYTFIDDLCKNENLRNSVMTYQHISSDIEESLKHIGNLCKLVCNDTSDSESARSCLNSTFKFLSVLLNIELFALRCHHSQLLRLCMKVSRYCLADSLELFSAILSQYKDEGRLPRELASVLNDGLPAILVPPILEPGKAGLPWLQVVGALCDLNDTQELVQQEVTSETFEDILYNVLQYLSQDGPLGAECSLRACVCACRIALCLSPLSNAWEATLGRILHHNLIKRILCTGLMSSNGSKRKQVLQLVKHHYFPSEHINQVFGDMAMGENECSVSSTLGANNSSASETESAWRAAPLVSPNHEAAFDSIISRMNSSLQDGKMNDLPTSKVMELYGYKMACLEYRLHSQTAALRSATQHIATLEQSLALHQATHTSQQDMMYTIQMQNESQEKRILEQQKQLEDAETTLRGFRAKLAGDKLDRQRYQENMQRECRAQCLELENALKDRQKEAEARIKSAEHETKEMQKKLEKQIEKNSELAGVLVKFEERVKHRDKRLEEATAAENSLRKDLEVKEASIKQLEKTVMERETRLYQVTSQLEEMKRVQEMVAKLMTKSASVTN